jgi:hypothetical protein
MFAIHLPTLSRRGVLVEELADRVVKIAMLRSFGHEGRLFDVVEHAHDQKASAGMAISTSAPVFSLVRWAPASGRMRSMK